jgi:hypothetical protein
MSEPAKQQQGSLRGVMPETAGLVDELRQVLGVEWANRLLLQGKAGKGCFWAQETGPDGVVREFGSKGRR